MRNKFNVFGAADRILKDRRGFTFIEVLTVTVMIVVMSAIFLVYGRTGESQLVLYKEQSRLLSMIYRVKSLSVETYTDPTIPCGYGMRLEPPNRYRLFRDLSANCATANHVYDAGDSLLRGEELYTLDPRITFSVVPAVTDIVFTPPDPRAFITTGSGTTTATTITLSAGAGNTLTVLVTEVGQINI